MDDIAFSQFFRNNCFLWLELQKVLNNNELKISISGESLYKILQTKTRSMSFNSQTQGRIYLFCYLELTVSCEEDTYYWFNSRKIGGKSSHLCER